MVCYSSLFRGFARLAIPCLGVLVALSAMPAVAGENLGKIMPLGDSITESPFIAGGYRDPLATLLTAAGDTFQFVGSSTTQSTPALVASGNTHHNGYSGATISYEQGSTYGIDDHLADLIGPGKVDANYILLMIGTNDINNGYASTAVARLNTLITHISNKTTGLRPNAHLIVASILPIKDAAKEQLVQTYNAGVLATVKAHQALGENVTFLDMHSYLTTADLADTLHPNQEGYNKMAAAWVAGIRAVPEPSSTALLCLGAGALLRRRRKA